MDNILQVKTLVHKIDKVRDTMPKEKDIKISLIVPFFQILDNSIFDPNIFFFDIIAELEIQQLININNPFDVTKETSIQMDVINIIHDSDGTWYSGICVIYWHHE